VRILLVDDHLLFREGLAGLLKTQPDMSVVAEAGTVAEAIALARDLEPDLILMDFSLPDGTGLDATMAILKAQPAIKIVFLTFHDDDQRLFAALRAGARGYLLKNVSTSKLVAYLRGVEEGEAALTPRMTGRILDEFAREGTPADPVPPLPAGLTPRELEVLGELATRATNQEIADRLFISENTVKNHVRSILSKLELQNRREAARFARERGLVGDTDPD
jgi:DNA-binding NarL/FixJ family response regulator